MSSTRNMVTGASTADLAVILIDARKGVLTRRAATPSVHLLGIRNIVLAVNKMDLVDYSQARFDEIVADYRAFAASIGIESFTALPISGCGRQCHQPSANTPWYTGPSLIAHLETVECVHRDQARPFRMPVQWVNRPNLDFRGFAGLIASGSVRRAMPCACCLRARPARSRGSSRWTAIWRGGGRAVGHADLADEIDCSRGDVIALADNPPEVADQFEASWCGWPTRR
jgi:bifunctional enzyme CysN/CysC